MRVTIVLVFTYKRILNLNLHQVMTKIYTKTGDTGETSLLGGKRVKKNCLEIDVIGEVDETNALLGVLASEMLDEKFSDIRKKLIIVQHKLFVVGSNLAAVQMKLGEMPKLVKEDIINLENWIDEMQSSLDPLTQFILPGGHEASAHAFVARSVCRRAERRLIDLVDQYQDLDPILGQYLNRLSDVLFVLARWINSSSGYKDVTWEK